MSAKSRPWSFGASERKVSDGYSFLVRLSACAGFVCTGMCAVVFGPITAFVCVGLFVCYEIIDVMQR